MPPKTSQTKSRNGCLLCKSRRIKCDEAKPACRRCEQKGIKCPGYARNLKWVTNTPFQSLPIHTIEESEAFTSIPSVQPVLETSLPRLPPVPEGLDCSILDTSMVSVPQSTQLTLPQVIDEEPNDFTWNDLFEDWAEESISSPQPINEIVENVENSNLHNDNEIFDSSLTILAPDLTLTQEIDDDHLMTPILTQELLNVPSALCDYFFKEVIPLFCAWDGQLNTMRVLSENLWQSSSILYHTIQSMAAACLAHDFPDLSSIAVKEHFQALHLLHDPSAMSKEENLFSLFLLGHTASWHSPHDLAIERYQAAQTKLKELHQEVHQNTNTNFFDGALDYWSMLLAFLTDRVDINYSSRPPFAGPTKPHDPIIPHPYSGISNETVRTLTDIGVLIFQYRKHMSRLRFISETDLHSFRKALTTARRLEKLLLDYSPASNPQIIDPGDPNTPVDHFRKIDEAYRCTGLLQLYRVFPDLLSDRYSIFNPADLLSPSKPTNSFKPTPSDRDTWLTSLALHTLSILRLIPFESNTRCVQPFILVAVASELRLPARKSLNAFDAQAIEVSRARKFVSARLSAYMHVLPLPKIRRIFELVQDLWARLDAGEREVYWLDMAYQKQMGTLMG